MPLFFLWGSIGLPSMEDIAMERKSVSYPRDIEGDWAAQQQEQYWSDQSTWDDIKELFEEIWYAIRIWK